jgi:hypothetical protein
MRFTELDGNQRRHLMNVKEVFRTWRDAREVLRRAGGMHWKTSENGKQYLYNTKGRVEKSLGVRSVETERIYAHQAERTIEAKERLETSWVMLEKQARLSKALSLGRLPPIAARILRKLDDVGLLDRALLVVGTNALFAYESGTGLFFEDTIIATDDLDLLWDSKQRISL